MKFRYLFILLILLSACDPSEKLPSTNDEVFRGSDGLNMNFIVNAPPPEIYPNQQFRTGITIRNLGAKYAADGYLLIGYEEDYMTLAQENIQSIYLEGRTLANIYGEEEKYFFDFESKNVDDQSTHHRSTIFATTCYGFKTDAAAQICVDTDIYNEKQGQKICSAQDISLNDQGAPVAIKKIEQDMLPMGDDKVKPIFKIYIKNVGDGQVVARNSIAKACSSEPLSRQDDIGVVTVDVKLGTTPLTCSPIPMHLERDTDYVRCWLEEGISTNFITYQSFLQIHLEYGYMTTRSRDVDIRRVID